MHRKSDNLYEAYVHGKLPDAWLVEVHDTAMGFRGHVSSLPQKLTDRAVERRSGRGTPKEWEEK